MKKYLFVTLADKSHVDYAKQLFSSVHFKAGWSGDYMILAYKLSNKDILWFKKRNIIVKKCKPLFKNEKPGEVKLCKFYLFTPEFRKWNRVVYIDADFIVRASLNRLLKVQQIAMARDGLLFSKILDKFENLKKAPRNEFIFLSKKYNFLAPALKSGIIAFNTNIISTDDIRQLKTLYRKYHRYCKSTIMDEPIFNLYFFKKWQELPQVYNINSSDFHFMNSNSVRRIALHLTYGEKRKLNKSPYFREWDSNFSKADQINTLKPLDPTREWTITEEYLYTLYLKARSLLHLPNLILIIGRFLGEIGFFLKLNYPSIYTKLKSKYNEQKQG